MGVAAVALVYDLTRRMFGRVAGSVAGLTFALTPITVAIARHNNPDELLILCCVAALWCAVRALETRRTKWLVLSGVCVGLGFETKMAVALFVVPGIALAWMWSRWGDDLARSADRAASAPRRRRRDDRRRRRLAVARHAHARRRPAVDLGYVRQQHLVVDLWIQRLGACRGANGRAGGRGRARGGGGGGFGGNLFGGATGPFRLLQSALGDQAGWLLGFAVVAGLALLVLTRLRRRDPRTGWLIAVGGAFLTTAVVFSFASGIFHPYYVSFLAPFAAALVGAGAGLMLPRSLGGAADGRAVARDRAARDRRRRDHRARRARRARRRDALGEAGPHRRRRGVRGPARDRRAPAGIGRSWSRWRWRRCSRRRRRGRCRPSATRPAARSRPAGRRALRAAAPAVAAVRWRVRRRPRAFRWRRLRRRRERLRRWAAGWSAFPESWPGRLRSGRRRRLPGRRWRVCRRSRRLRRRHGLAQCRGSLRRAARWRGDRRLQSEHGRRRDSRRLHERRRPRRVLRAGKLGERELDRDGGPGGPTTLGDRRQHRRSRPPGRHPDRQPGGDGCRRKDVPLQSR